MNTRGDYFRKWCGRFLLLAGAHWCMAGPSDADQFAQGNVAFAAGKYADAIHEYEALQAKGECSVPLLYNLANACYRDGRIGAAILNYERAQWFAPGDPDIRANLQFARRSAGLFEPAPGAMEKVADFLSLNAWAWIFTLLLALLCASQILRMLRRGAAGNARPVTLLLALACGISLAAVFTRMMETNRAVIISPETPLMVAPLEGSPSSYALAAGSLVRVDKQRDHFLFVRTEEGRRGWISDTHLEPVVTQKFRDSHPSEVPHTDVRR